MADQQQQQQEQQQQTPQPGTQAVLHPTLVPELLGFSPQMLLDDIISAAADAILQCLQAMEPFMQRWADARVQKASGANNTSGNGNDAEGARKRNADERDAEWDGLEAVEQGLVAFQTLLESHTDIAFDFFEAWSLRNIFTLAPDLPVVAPHQRGLDLRTRPEEETALMTDIEDLRRRIENQRRLKSTYLKALRISRIGRARTERLLFRLAYLSPTSPTSSTPNALAALTSLPPAVHELFESAAALPHAAGLAAGAPALADASRRQWETGRTGYVNWAVGQLVARSKQMGTPAAGGSTAVSNAAAHIAGVGDVRDVKALADVVAVEEEHERDSENDMDTS